MLCGRELGVSLADVASSDAHYRRVRDLLVQQEVLFFRDQEKTPAVFAAFAKAFGDVLGHPAYATVNDAPDVQILESTPENPSKIEVWHSDMTFMQCPPSFTLLQGQIGPRGGRRYPVASATAAYDALSPEMRDFLTPLKAVNDFRHGFRQVWLNRVVPNDWRRRLQRIRPSNIRWCALILNLVGRPFMPTRCSRPRSLDYRARKAMRCWPFFISMLSPSNIPCAYLGSRVPSRFGITGQPNTNHCERFFSSASIDAPSHIDRRPAGIAGDRYANFFGSDDRRTWAVPSVATAALAERPVETLLSMRCSCGRASGGSGSP